MEQGDDCTQTSESSRRVWAQGGSPPVFTERGPQWQKALKTLSTGVRIPRVLMESNSKAGAAAGKVACRHWGRRATSLGCCNSEEGREEL